MLSPWTQAGCRTANSSRSWGRILLMRRGKELPPTIVSSELYPPLVMLLIGMFAAVSVRNLHTEARSLLLDLLAVACGIAVLTATFIRGESGMVAVGIVLTGAGIGAALVKRGESAMSKVLLIDSHLHDFAEMLLVCFSVRFNNISDHY